MSKKIVLGTAQFGLDYGITNEAGVVCDSQMNGIIDLCIDSGVELLDTAPAYGTSELRLGRNTRVQTGDIKVVTKTKSEDRIVESGYLISNIDKSLARLGVGSLYGLLIHDPKAFCSKNKDCYLDMISYVKKNRIAQKVGISIYNRSEIDSPDILNVIDFVQLPFSIFDQRLKIDGFLEKLKTYDVEIHARSVFLQGLLLSNDASKLPGINRYHEQFIDMINREGITKVEAAIKFVDNIKEIDKIIIGSTSIEQMREIISAIKIELDTSEWGYLAINNPNLVDPTKW